MAEKETGKVVCFKTASEAKKFVKTERKRGRKSTIIPEKKEFFGMKFICVGTY